MTCAHCLSHEGSGAPNGQGPRFLEPAEPAIATPLTIGPPGPSYDQRYDIMQMRYSCQLLTIYSCAFISEGGFCRCVVLSYEDSIIEHNNSREAVCNVMRWLPYITAFGVALCLWLRNASYHASSE